MADIPDISAQLGTISLAVAALGAASYGVVDGVKFFSWIDLSGFEYLFSSTAGGRWWPRKHKADLDCLVPVLEIAYGDEVMDVLKAQYRAGRAKGDLSRTLKQGVRAGFDMMEADEITGRVRKLGIDKDIARSGADALKQEDSRHPSSVGAMQAETPVPSTGNDAHTASARLMTAVDARIEAALLLADNQFATQTKVYAMLVALVISIGVGLYLKADLVLSFLVGIAAVPLAPVGKDLATALQQAVKTVSK